MLRSDGCYRVTGRLIGGTMLLIRSRAVLAGVVCAVSVAMVGVSIADATTAPPDDTSGETTESGGPPSSGEGVADTSEATASASGRLEILPPEEEWGGATRGEWDARWWQWTVSFPEEVNPNFDTSGGERCGYGQFGPVFFLPGNFIGEAGVITCVVAEGTAIYASPAGAECSTVEPPPFFGRDEEELRACATARLDEVKEYEATIDGQDLGDLEAYRTSSPLFTLTLSEDNPFGLEPGVGQAVSESYGFIIAPPPPGEYEITLSVTFVDSQQFATTINLVVEAPQVIEPPASTAPGSTGPVETSSPSSETTEAADTTPPATSEATETTSVATETTSPA